MFTDYITSYKLAAIPGPDSTYDDHNNRQCTRNLHINLLRNTSKNIKAECHAAYEPRVQVPQMQMPNSEKHITNMKRDKDLV